MIEMAGKALMDSAVPANAAVEFWAGVLQGWEQADADTEATQKALVEECFTADQKMADAQADLVTELQQNHFKQFIATVKEYEQYWDVDFATCKSDPKYKAIADAKAYQGAIEAQARTDPEGQKKMDKVMVAHAIKLRALEKQLFAAWAAGDYYGAGKPFGEVEKIVYEPWITPSQFLN